MNDSFNQARAGRRPFGEDWFAELRQSLSVMFRVVNAVILREARTRYGNSKLGYTWAVIDPLVTMAVLITVFTLIGRTSPVPAPLPVFFLTGIGTLLFWRGSVGQAANAVSASLGLLAYPPVMPADIVLARILLEAATTALVFLLFIFSLYFLYDISPHYFFGNPAQVLLFTVCFVYFTLGCAFLSAGLGRILPVWSNIWGYSGRPIFLLSGVFFTIEQLPEPVRTYMTYNPVAHMVEWFRSAAIPGFESQFYTVTYPLSIATVFLLAGLAIDRILLMTGDEEIVS